MDCASLKVNASDAAPASTTMAIKIQFLMGLPWFEVVTNYGAHALGIATFIAVKLLRHPFMAWVHVGSAAAPAAAACCMASQEFAALAPAGPKAAT